jgi:hypothetical protein
MRSAPPSASLLPAAHRIKVKLAGFNGIATSGEDTRSVAEEAAAGNSAPNLRAPAAATARVGNLMADFSCASTKQTSHWRFRVILTAAAFALAGCNANQAVNLPSQPPSQVFAGHYVEYNPYDPISYAQNNTGRGGGR